jgi:hypothetical protein
MEKLKWFFGEIMKLYSPQKSYFSKKRIESGIAFIIAQWGMIYYMYSNYSKLTMEDVVLWAGVEFAMAGWMIHKIQKEKTGTDSEEN